MPNNIYKNWLHPTTGEWLIGFLDKKVIYKTKNWEYGEITSNPGRGYWVKIMGIDTICYTNDKGVKLCKLVARYDSIGITKSLEGYNFTLSDYNNISLVNTFNEVDYQPTAVLPVPKTGTAVVKVQYMGNPNDMKGEIVKVNTNNTWFMGQMEYSTSFNDEGYAMLEVPMAQAQPVYAMLKGYGSVFLSPGDTLYAAFDGAWSRRFEKAIWMGKHAQINYDLCKYDSKIWGLGEFSKESKNLLLLEIDEYKNAREALTNKLRKRDEDYFTKNTCSPGFIELTEIRNQVQEWNDLMRYRWMPERFRRNRPQFPMEYFDFLKEIDFADLAHWYSEEMAWFLSEVSNWLQSAGTERISLNQTEVIEYILNSDIEIPDSINETMQNFIDHQNAEINGKQIKDIVEGFYSSWKTEIDSVYNSLENKKDFEIVDFYRKKQTQFSADDFELISEWITNSRGMFNEDLKNFTQPYINQIYSEKKNKKIQENLSFISKSENIKDLFLKMMALRDFKHTLENLNEADIKWGYADLIELNLTTAVQEMVDKSYEKTLAIIAQPMPGDVNLETVAPGSANEFMAKLAQKHKGKVVYIDVWAPWCAPCRGELKNAPALKKNFEGKDVVFAYVCGSGSKDAWQNCIKQFNVNGDHYFIAENTYEELRAKYAIKGIPHFMIMDKDGKIVEFKSSRPGNIKETSRRLNSYL